MTQHKCSEKQQKRQKPRSSEKLSLADVYEGALRNVLGIQLRLTLDDQQSFTQDAINDLLFRDKTSSSQNRASSRHENLKRRSENYQRERLGEESKDIKNSVSFQGRTLLRDPRRMSPGGSAFHVPPKKARIDEETKYTERGYPMDRYGVPPPGTNFPSDYHHSFPSPRGSPGMYHRRFNGPEAITHIYGTNGIHIPVARDHYSLWSVGHYREVPTLFPVRCSAVENERRFHRGFLEEEKRRRMDLARLNGFAHEKTSVRVKIEETKEEELKRDMQKPSPTERRTLLALEKDTRLEKRAEREKLSPSSPSKSKPNALLTTYRPSRSSPVNGTGAIDFRMETRYRSALRKMESRREGRKGTSEDAKEEFLFKLGLERIEA